MLAAKRRRLSRFCSLRYLRPLSTNYGGRVFVCGVKYPSNLLPKYWKTKFSNDVDDATVQVKDTVRATATAKKGVTDLSVNAPYGSTILDDAEVAEKNVIKSSTKKHWWNRK